MLSLGAETVRLMLAGALVVGGAVAGVEALENAYSAGAGTARQVQAVHDAQLMRAARTACVLNEGPAACETEGQLIERGWLAPEFAERERFEVLDAAQLRVQIEAAGQ